MENNIRISLQNPGKIVLLKREKLIERLKEV